MAEKKITLADVREEALFARMPGRRSIWSRRAPEIWAGVLYCVFLVVWLTPEIIYRPQNGLGAPPRPEWCAKWGLVPGAYLACFLAGPVLFFGAVISGGLAWARERDQRTLEPLLLTTLNFSAVVSLRFWHVLWPWVRLALYLLPLYLLMGGAGFFGFANSALKDGFHRDAWVNAALGIFGCRPLAVAVFTWNDLLLWTDWSLLGCVLALLRLANDLAVTTFACAAAYFISARARSGARALLTTWLLVPPLLVLQDLPVLLLFGCDATGLILGDTTVDVFVWGYGFICLAAFAARIWLALWLVRRAARNFDWYALGEKPPK